MSQPGNGLVEVHHRHQRVGVVGSLSEKCPRGQLGKSPTRACQCKVVPGHLPLLEIVWKMRRNRAPRGSEHQKPMKQTHTKPHTHTPKSLTTMRYTTTRREQAEPTLLRATPWLGGVNTQHTSSNRAWWEPSRRTSMAGTLSNHWGKAWNSKGDGYPGRSYCPGGDQGGQRMTQQNRAPLAAPAVVFGKGIHPWGGRGRGWVQRVPQVPYCSSLPGTPNWKEGSTSGGGEGGGHKGRQPQNSWWGAVWSLSGRSHPEQGQWTRGDQQGKGKNRGALSAAPAMSLGKGAFAWGGRGRGQGRGVPQVPFRSGPPGSPRRGEGPTPSAVAGKKGKGKGDQLFSNAVKANQHWQ